MVDIRQTKEYAAHLQNSGWVVETKAGVNYFVKKILGLGILKVQRPEHLAFKTINKISQNYGVFQVIVEPKTKMDAEYLASNGYKLSKSPFLPTKTLILDLTKSKGELWNSLNKKTRYSIKRGEGSKTKEMFSEQDIETFRKAWKKSVGFSRFVPSNKNLLSLKKTFTKCTPLFLASHNNSAEIIGGSLFTRNCEKVSYYWQAFSSKEGRASLSSHALLWQGILWAKSKGCRIMDLEGIYDPRFPNKAWQGFTRFKKSFGGEEKEYPGAFAKYRFPL